MERSCSGTREKYEEEEAADRNHYVLITIFIPPPSLLNLMREEVKALEMSEKS